MVVIKAGGPVRRFDYNAVNMYAFRRGARIESIINDIPFFLIIREMICLAS